MAPTQRAPSGARVQSWRLKVGQSVAAVIRDHRGHMVDAMQLWQVVEADRRWLTLRSTNGDTIKLRR